MMLLVFCRVLLTVGAVAWAIMGSLVLVFFDVDRAIGNLVACVGLAWIARPNNEDMAAFEDFQKRRMAQQKIKR